MCSLVFHTTFTKKMRKLKHDVETESELDELILKHNKIIITGEQKAGKTVLARKLFRIFLEKGKTPY